jgi:hypothetical protein
MREATFNPSKGRNLDGDETLALAFQPDADQGINAHLTVTLSTANTLTVVTLPDWARGFTIRPSADTRFAVSEAPAAAAATSSATTVAANAFGVGGLAFATTPQSRRLPFRVGRTLQLRSATASATVAIDLF